VKKLALLVVVAISLFASKGKQLFEQKCVFCHAKTPPATMQEREKMIAPPIGNVLYHLDMSFKTADEIKSHINSFVMNPTKEKAICNSVKRFGLMPSQKGVLTKDELNQISEFLTNIIIYSKNSHKKRKGCGGGCAVGAKKGGCGSSGSKGGCGCKKGQ
jgi:cytochrome c553